MKKWVREIYHDTYKFWKQNKDRYSNIYKGFAIFYSPVRINPTLMVFGLNPGWTKNDIFNEATACNMPEKHDYFTYVGDTRNDYELAMVMRGLFEYMDLTEVLKTSVKLNLIFFRTSDEELKSQTVYNEMKNFSKEKNKLILEKINPRVILTEGLGVYDEMINMFEGTDQKTLIKDDQGNRVLMSGKIGNSTIIGMIHPSGQFTKNHFQKNKDKIAREIKTLIKI